MPDPQTEATIAAVSLFNEVFNTHDADAIMAAMTDDVVFENTLPRPDGERFQGQAAVRAFWEQLFRGSPNAHFETEDMFAVGDQCAVRWLYTWLNADGSKGHVRGVDLFRVRDDTIAEKLSYVKG